MKKKLGVNWKQAVENPESVMKQFDFYLRNLGIRDSTRMSYVDRTQRFLRFCGKTQPTVDDFNKFREHLVRSGLSRSSINNYSFAAKRFYEMNGMEISFPFLKPNNMIPDSFPIEDVKKILKSSRGNLKHHTMLTMLFECSLRATELCNLNIRDVDLVAHTLHLRDTKNGQDAKIPLSANCIFLLGEYLKIRPNIEIDNRTPLFFTDFGRLWDRRDLYRMFMTYKKAAGVKTKGGLHVFSRHSSATLMIEKGVDVTIVNKLLRHRSISTTMRYLHVRDEVIRDAHSKFIESLV
jgi:integrase/recombinase XerD